MLDILLTPSRDIVTNLSHTSACTNTNLNAHMHTHVHIHTQAHAHTCSHPQAYTQGCFSSSLTNLLFVTVGQHCGLNFTRPIDYFRAVQVMFESSRSNASSRQPSWVWSSPDSQVTKWFNALNQSIVPLSVPHVSHIVTTARPDPPSTSIRL